MKHINYFVTLVGLVTAVNALIQVMPVPVLASENVKFERTIDTLYMRLNLNGITEKDILVTCNDDPIHPLAYNPVDGYHYGALWLGDGVGDCSLSFGDPVNYSEENIPVRTKPTKPANFSNIFWVSPSGMGSLTKLDPGSLSAAVAAANVATGATLIYLMDGEYFGGGYEVSASNITICAVNTGMATISGQWNTSSFDYSLLDGSKTVYRVEGVLPT